MRKTKIKKILEIVAGIGDVLIFPLILLVCLIVRICKNRYSKQRVFMGTMCINNWVYVAEALRKRGYFVKVVVWERPMHEKNVPYDYVFSENKIFGIFRNNHIRVDYFYGYVIFLWSVLKFDIFIMPFRDRILDRCVLLGKLELPLLKFANKKIILNSYGSDIQTPRKSLSHKKIKYTLLTGYLEDTGYYKNLDENRILRNRIHCEKWADVIIGAIDHLDYLKRVDVVLHMRCLDLEKFVPKRVEKRDSDKLIILHAANHRALKGTDYIIKAVDALKNKGYDIELIILEKCPYEFLRKKMEEADIIIDQLIIGAYARFAIEAMSLEKPVVCYLREDLFDKNPIWRECPIVNANPDNLVQVLESLVRNKDMLRVLGKRGREYVKKYHSLEYIGEKLSEIIERLD